MKELQPSQELLYLLAEYHRAGGVIDYALIDPGRVGSSSEIHREAAVFGLRAISAREIFPPDYRAVTIGPLTFSLPGWTWLWKRKKLTHTVSDYFWPGQELTFHVERLKGTRIEIETFLNGGDSCDFVTKGYKSAFYRPPYPMELPASRMDSLYRSMNERLFRNLKQVNEIYNWSTDWSSYFDQGHEWWGAFLWTGQRDQNSPIVWMGASASD